MAELLYLGLGIWLIVVSCGLFWILIAMGEIARLHWRRARRERQRRRDLASALYLLAIRTRGLDRSQQPAPPDAALPALPAADAGMEYRRRCNGTDTTSLADDMASTLRR